MNLRAKRSQLFRALFSSSLHVHVVKRFTTRLKALSSWLGCCRCSSLSECFFFQISVQTRITSWIYSVTLQKKKHRIMLLSIAVLGCEMLSSFIASRTSWPWPDGRRMWTFPQKRTKMFYEQLKVMSSHRVSPLSNLRWRTTTPFYFWPISSAN